MKAVFDIGGTNMRVAVADGEKLGEIRKIRTPQEPKEGIAALARIVGELAAGRIDAAAGDIAGRLGEDGRVFDAKNLHAWEGVAIERELSEALGAPVRVLNDAVVVGLGEARRGAARDFMRAAYITVSTGVGGALIVDDLAHAPLLADLHLSMGDLEYLISGTAVEKKYGIHPKELDSLEERNSLADILAEGLVEIFAAWKPDVFVLGGSMIVGVNPIPLERVEERLRARTTPVQVKMAELGDSAGLYGALTLIGDL